MCICSKEYLAAPEQALTQGAFPVFPPLNEVVGAHPSVSDGSAPTDGRAAGVRGVRVPCPEVPPGQGGDSDPHAAVSRRAEACENPQPCGPSLPPAVPVIPERRAGNALPPPAAGGGNAAAAAAPGWINGGQLEAPRS